jgi:hypothetical protein
VRPLSVLELAAIFAIGGSMLAAAVPSFVSNLHASRMAEPVDALGRLSASAIAASQGKPTASAFPESAPLTPSTIAAGVQVSDPPGTWDHPTWRALGFAWDTPHAYSFAFESRNGPERAVFSARAEGDLDGDGVTSSFEMDGFSTGSTNGVGPLEVWRAVE